MKPWQLLLLITGVLILSKSAPRGIRNNNPMNIRENHLVDFDWVGEHQVDLDKEFEEFESPVMGIRAGTKVLMTYRNKHGIDTITGIINRWAPPSENDTDAYIQSVAQRLGYDANEPLPLAAYSNLVEAIIHHENGQQPYSRNQIEQGVRLGIA